MNHKESEKLFSDLNSYYSRVIKKAVYLAGGSFYKLSITLGLSPGHVSNTQKGKIEGKRKLVKKIVKEYECGDMDI